MSKSTTDPESTKPHVWRSARNYADHMSDLPLADRFGMQLSRGPHTWRSIKASGRDCVLVRLDMDHSFAGYVVPERGWTAVTTPLGWEGDYIFNGRTANPGDVFVVDAANGYSTRSQAVRSVGMGFRTELLEATVGALEGRADDPRPLPVGKLNLPASLGHWLRRRLAHIFACTEKRRDGLFALFPTAEQEMYEAAAQAIVEHDRHDEIAGKGVCDAAIVKRAVDAARESESIPALADLCKAAAAGQTKLFHSFVSVYGMPPNQFLRRMRMEMAHDRLTDCQTPPVSVKEVALALGFPHGGRFAAEYKALFNASPSDMLRLAHREAAGGSLLS